MNVTAETELRLIATELKKEAERLGFFACGISRAEQLEGEARQLEQWLNLGFHASMGWMEGHFEKRIDPRKLVEGTQTVISVLDNYYHPSASPSIQPETGKISKYAAGDDYHLVVKERLGNLFAWLDDRVGGISGRAFVDSAPVMDKVWAQRSGLGWIGKHSNVINQRIGSYFFIGELLVDIPLPPDAPTTDHCGSCTRCIDACPTDAIVDPYVVDANRCISYLTIENRDQVLNPDFADKLDGWIFGCDICQDVCPWNKFKQQTNEPRFTPRDGVTGKQLSDWVELSLEDFRKLFKNSPVKRAKHGGLTRNATAASQAR